MSDEQTLDHLIAKVKTEAIDNAKKEAQRIIATAQEKAKTLLNKAESDKDTIINAAEKEAEAIIAKGEIALQQAARDVVLSTQQQVLQRFKTLLGQDIEKALNPELYAAVILKLVEVMGKNITVTMPEAMSDNVMIAVRQQFKEDIILKENTEVVSGLRISKTDAGWHYDLTAEAIAELLSEQLNPKWVKFLNQD